MRPDSANRPDRKPRHTTPALYLPVLMCVFWLGCNQAVRRPTTSPAPWWSDAAEAEVVIPAQSPDQTGTTAIDTTDAEAPASEPTATATDGAAPIETALPLAGPRIFGVVPIKQWEPEERQTVVELSDSDRARLQEAYRQRTARDRERVAQVNAYALWCVQRQMWAEARTHLEQAIAQDSLAASLHNNLGILYEQVGEPERARAAYERALVLQPDKMAYQSNLNRQGGADEPRGLRDRRDRRRLTPDGRDPDADDLLRNLVHD